MIVNMLIGELISSLLCFAPHRRLKPTVISFADLKIEPPVWLDIGSGEIETSPWCALLPFVSISTALLLAAALTQFPAALAAGGGGRAIWVGVDQVRSVIFFNCSRFRQAYCLFILLPVPVPTQAVSLVRTRRAALAGSPRVKRLHDSPVQACKAYIACVCNKLGIGNVSFG